MLSADTYNKGVAYTQCPGQGRFSNCTDGCVDGGECVPVGAGKLGTTAQVPRSSRIEILDWGTVLHRHIK
jgi:hypothetical protein